MPAVVAPQDDDRFVGEARLIERVEHFAELRVHVADGGVVAVDERALEVVGQHAVLRDVFVLAQLAAKLRRILRRSIRWRAALGQRKSGAVVEVPVFLRRAEREMRLQESHPDEKWRARALFRRAKSGDGFGCDLAVGVGVIGDIGGFVGRAAWKILRAFIGEVSLLAREPILRGALREQIRDALRLPVRHAPRSRVFGVPVADVENLPHRLRAPSIRDEVLRERHRIRRGFAEVRPEVVNAERRRAETRHQRVARRRAHRLVAIRAVEDHPTRREAVEVRRLHRFVAVAAKQRLQIIHADEQDVWPIRSAANQSAKEKEKCSFHGPRVVQESCGEVNASFLGRTWNESIGNHVAIVEIGPFFL